jgi:hypothetical protein
MGPGQVEGAETRLHTVIEKSARHLIVAKKTHVGDEEDALRVLYMCEYFTGEALGVWSSSVTVAVHWQWPSGSGISQDSLLTLSLVFMLEKYVNPRGKMDIEERLDKIAWDPSGVMASQALFTT